MLDAARKFGEYLLVEKVEIIALRKSQHITRPRPDPCTYINDYRTMMAQMMA